MKLILEKLDLYLANKSNDYEILSQKKLKLYFSDDTKNSYCLNNTFKILEFGLADIANIATKAEVLRSLKDRINLIFVVNHNLNIQQLEDEVIKYYELVAFNLQKNTMSYLERHKLENIYNFILDGNFKIMLKNILQNN